MDSENTKTELSYLFQTLIPKKHTQAQNFVSEHPNYDGRNIIIAIWDTGVDPCAAGLQVTSDGKPKIIDMIDASGSGDVDMSTTKIISANNRNITALSGKSVQIPSNWVPVDNKIHLGVKPAFELFPEALRNRLIKEFKDDYWCPEIRRLYALVAQMAEKMEDSSSPKKTKLQKENVQCMEECLGILDKKFAYNGPVYDCYVFHNGTNWVACVDTTPFDNCDLSKLKLMTNFCINRDVCTFGPDDMMNYSINIYDDGNLLEIVTTTSSHGTHVSAIAAANYPDNPEKNGIAPGAQIISCKISDHRLASMETGTALMRAAAKVVSTGCDIVNYSFGEASNVPNTGRVSDMISELVFKHGVIFCSSSGNHGPALTTVGTPGGTTDGVIGVAPFVYPDMMEVEYSLSEPLAATPYTWASRGPAADGHIGITLGAPGGAIASVANWMLRSGQLMNGSSMSSPSACGGIAILISALKQLNQPYTPHFITRAVSNTCQSLGENHDPLCQGQGSLQIKDAFDYCQRYYKSNDKRQDLPDGVAGHLFRLKVNLAGDKRGIYIREPHLQEKQISYSVFVQPHFCKDHVAPHLRVNMELQLSIQCDVPWVQCPKYLVLMNQERMFTVHVDPTKLPEDGSYHFTEIVFHHSNEQVDSPLTRLPVTVMRPLKVPPGEAPEFTFVHVFKSQSKIHRKFFALPEGTSCAEITIKATGCLQRVCRFVLHCLELSPCEKYSAKEFHKSLQLGDNASPQLFALPCSGGRTLELCLAQWWSTLCDGMQITYTIRFHGLRPDHHSITLHSGDAFQRVCIRSHFGRVEVAPSISLTHWVLPTRPTESRIRLLKNERDQLPKQRYVSALELTYTFSLVKANDVTLVCPLLNDLLYENEYQSQIWMLFDCNKRYLASGDYNPTSYTVKLEKGEYTVLMQVQHEKKEMLDKLKDMQLLVHCKFTSNLNFDVADSLVNLAAGKSFSNAILQSGSTKPIYIGAPAEEKFPKGVVPGSYFLGTISFYKNELLKKTVVYPFKYIVSELAHKKTPSTSAGTVLRSQAGDLSVSANTPPAVSAKSHSVNQSTASDVTAVKDQQQAVLDANTTVSQPDPLDDKDKQKDMNSYMNDSPENPSCHSSAKMIDGFDEGDLNRCTDLLSLPTNKLANISELEEQIDNMRISWLPKLPPDSQSALYSELLSKLGPDCVNLMHSRLLGLNNEKDPDRWRMIVDLAPKLIEIWDTKELAQFTASKSNDFPLPPGKTKSEMEKQRTNLIDVLSRYGWALCKLITMKNEMDRMSEVDSVHQNLLRWASDKTDGFVGLFLTQYGLLCEHHGWVLKLLLKIHDEKPSKVNELRIIKVLKKLDWQFFAKCFEEQLPIRYPHRYRPF